MSRFWSSDLSKLQPYTPGEQPVIKDLVKLNTNENPYPPSPKVIEAINDTAKIGLQRYPDPKANLLKEAIAEHYDLQTENVFVANSSDEVLAHVFRAFFKDKEKVKEAIFFPDLTYSFYPVWCKLYDVPYQQIPLDQSFRINVDDYSAQNGGIIFANPNAPTGIALEVDQIKFMLERHADSVVVVDEAYADFSNVSVVNLVCEYPNLLVTQTLSKSRSLAGLRVGLACGSAHLIEGLERVKNSFHPYALDSLAIAGATASFEDTAYFEDCCAKIISTRDGFSKALQDLDFTVLPSQANFVLVSHPRVRAEQLFQQLRERGIVVRYFDTDRIDNYLRISIGDDLQMQTLTACLAELVA